MLAWRMCMYAVAALALVLAVCAAPLVHDPHPVRSPARPDVPGLAIGSVALIALAFGFDRAQTTGWTTPLTLILLTGGALLLGLRVAADRFAPFDRPGGRTQGP